MFLNVFNTERVKSFLDSLIADFGLKNCYCLKKSKKKSFATQSEAQEDCKINQKTVKNPKTSKLIKRRQKQMDKIRRNININVN